MNISQFISENTQYLKKAKNRKKLRNRFPDEFRDSVVVAASKGVSVAELASVAGVHPTTVRKWIQEKAEKSNGKFLAIPAVTRPARPQEIKIHISPGTKVTISAD